MDMRNLIKIVESDDIDSRLAQAQKLAEEAANHLSMAAGLTVSKPEKARVLIAAAVVALGNAKRQALIAHGFR